MKWKERISKIEHWKSKLFILLSMIFIIGLSCIYGYRLIHYYRLEHPKVVPNDSTQNQLASKIKQTVVTEGEGLYNSNQGYYFKGKEVNNYVFYSGLLWRIISIDEDDQIRMITEETVTSMVFHYESTEYDTSYIKMWLNDSEVEHSGLFMKALNDVDTYLVESDFCVDQIADLSHMTCNQTSHMRIGLLSLTEYQQASGSKSYLNTGDIFWTTNGDSEEGIWYVDSEGKLGKEVKRNDSYHSFGVRPVIVIKGNMDTITGDGSKESPYQFETERGNTLKDKSVGRYISYSGYVWKVIGKEEGKIKLAMDGFIEDDGEYVLSSYSDDTNLFITDDRTNIGYYLDTVFYRTLDHPEYIVESNFYIGGYSGDTRYDYRNIYTEVVTSKVGLLTIGDLFIHDYYDYAFMTPTTEIEESIYTTTEDRRLYLNTTTVELKVRPVIYLIDTIEITGGSGKKEDPYILID